MRAIPTYILAAFAEIGGCFAFWAWLRLGKTALWLAPGATQASVAAELGVTPTQLKTWRLELEAAGSASAIERQQAEAGELARLRQDNKRLKEEVEVLRKASAFFAQWAAKT